MSNVSVIFGDVHGEAGKLAELVRLVRERFGPDADLHSVGDLIDRGPDSKGVLDICVREGVRGVLGNHELWLRDVVEGRPFNDGVYSKIMGGLATLRSYGVERGDPTHVGPAILRAMPESHKAFIRGLPPYRRLDVAGRTHWLVHAGLSADSVAGVLHEYPTPPSEDALVQLTARSSRDLFFWMTPKVREPHRMHRFASGSVQVLGHIPVGLRPIDQPHYIALDTGCGTCPPDVLSAVALLPDGRREFIQVRSAG